jgi:glycosyltransferase involved in cell wall biosynthesis
MGNNLIFRPYDIRMAIATLEGGGNERDCLRLANQWAEEGKRVEILLVRKRGVYLERLDKRISVFSAEKSRSLYAIPVLVRHLMASPEVPVLIFGFELGAGLGAAKTARWLRSPLIYREGSLPRSAVPARRRWAYGMFIAKADGLVAQTRYALKELQELGVAPRYRKVIWNPSELSGTDSATSRASVAPLFPLRLVTVGRLSHEKGLMRLLEGFASYRKLHPGATLVLAGEGPQRAELQAEVERLDLAMYVRFLGFVSDVGDLYRNADVLVLPSFFEGLPNVLLEALDHGCPTMAAGGEGVREVLDELGLAECWWEGADFARDFPSMIERVGNLPRKKWWQARQLLESKTRAAVVASAYFELCRGAASIELEVSAT